jgi:hypothetical protein
MAIASVDDIAAAFGAGTKQLAVINKASIATQAAAGYTALWRATGTPAQGAIPATVVVPTKATTGALLNFTNAGGSDKLYIGKVWANSANSGTTLFIYDRLSHCGGLSGATTGNQNADVDASDAGLSARCNQTTYTDVEYWWEIYTDIGTSAQTCTVTYELVGGGTATTTFSLGGASPLNQDSRTFRINIPVPATGITTVSIGTTTGTGGSWGVTARKLLATIPLPLANYTNFMDWAQLGLPEVPDDACLEMVLQTGTTTSGVLVGGVDLITK